MVPVWARAHVWVGDRGSACGVTCHVRVPRCDAGAVGLPVAAWLAGLNIKDSSSHVHQRCCPSPNPIRHAYGCAGRREDERTDRGHPGRPLSCVHGQRWWWCPTATWSSRSAHAGGRAQAAPSCAHDNNKRAPALRPPQPHAVAAAAAGGRPSIFTSFGRRFSNDVRPRALGPVRLAVVGAVGRFFQRPYGKAHGVNRPPHQQLLVIGSAARAVPRPARVVAPRCYCQNGSASALSAPGALFVHAHCSCTARAHVLRQEHRDSFSRVVLTLYGSWLQDVDGHDITALHCPADCPAGFTYMTQLQVKVPWRRAERGCRVQEALAC